MYEATFTFDEEPSLKLEKWEDAELVEEGYVDIIRFQLHWGFHHDFNILKCFGKYKGRIVPAVFQRADGLAGYAQHCGQNFLPQAMLFP